MLSEKAIEKIIERCARTVIKKHKKIFKELAKY